MIGFCFEGLLNRIKTTKETDFSATVIQRLRCQYSHNKMGKAHISKEKKGKNKRLRTRN